MRARIGIKIGLFCGLGAFLLSGCGIGVPGAGGGCAPQNPPPPAKYVSYANVPIHDPESSEYNDDCIRCHGDKLNEVGLDGVTPTGHSSMRYVVAGQGNDRCKACHIRGPDFLTRSAGGLRRQVNPFTCVPCHGPDAEVPLYRK